MSERPGFPHPTGFETLHWACVEALSAIRHGEETDGHLAHLTNVLNMARNRRGMMPLVPDPPRDHLSEAEEKAARLRRERDQLREVAQQAIRMQEMVHDYGWNYTEGPNFYTDLRTMSDAAREILDATTPEEEG